MRINIKKSLIIVIAGWMFAGCSSKNIDQNPTTDLKLVSKAVLVNVASENVQPDILEILSREIKGQLIIAGFDLIDSKDEEINLNVNVIEFTPGNAALRLTVGFGAGRGSLIYTAEYTDPEGIVLAKMEGQERFTGLEVGYNNNYGAATTLGGEETATKVLVKEAAKHIVELSTAQQQ